MKSFDYKELIEKYFLNEISDEQQEILTAWLLKDRNNVQKYVKTIIMLNTLQKELTEAPDQIKNINYLIPKS